MINKAPNLPKAPHEYNEVYMDQLLRILTAYFRTIDNPGHLQAITANFSYMDGVIQTRGLVRVNLLAASLAPGATSITLDTAINFPSEGSAFIVDGPNSDKIHYTSKTSTELLGVTGITKNHGSNKLVVASARTGDIYADPLNEFTLKIIP